MSIQFVTATGGGCHEHCKDCEKCKDCKSRGTIYQLLDLSFPDFSERQFDRICNGRSFITWVIGMIDDNAVACAAIFRSKESTNTVTYTRMGLFCVHPQWRERKIGTQMYHYLIEKYGPLEWTASTEEAIGFYTRIGAVNCGKIRNLDGTYYTHFFSSIVIS